MVCGSSFAIALGGVFYREASENFMRKSLQRLSEEKQLRNENIDLLNALKEVEQRRSIAENALKDLQTKYHSIDQQKQDAFDDSFNIFEQRIADAEYELKIKNEDFLHHQDLCEDFARRNAVLQEELNKREKCITNLKDSNALLTEQVQNIERSQIELQEEIRRRERSESYIVNLENDNVMLREQIQSLEINQDGLHKAIKGLELKIEDIVQSQQFTQEVLERSSFSSALRPMSYKTPLKYKRNSLDSIAFDFSAQTFDYTPSKSEIQNRISALIKKHNHNKKILLSNN